MITKIDVAAAFFIALALSYLITPFMAFLAAKLNLLDQPARKKSHAHPTPLLGGLAIYFAFLTALSFTVYASRPLIGVLVGATVLMVIGVVDDKFGMLPNIKITGQLIAALIAVKLGVRVAFLKQPHISMLFTCIWLIGMTNAFNLLDNLNGLSAGIAGISAFFFGTIAFIHGDYLVAIVSFALMGACFGFLRHNFPRRASIFMGDAGSLFLGFMLACIAVIGTWKTSSVTTSLAIPILILAYPIMDTTLVTIKRLQEGRSIFKGGKDHSSHRLAILGLKKKRAVLILYLVNLVLGVAALLMTVLGAYFDFVVMIIAGALLAAFAVRLGTVRIKYR